MTRLKHLSLCLAALSLALGGCAGNDTRPSVDAGVVAAPVDSTPAVDDSLTTPVAELEEAEDLDETLSEWTVRDRALAFKPELQSLQETYDEAVALLAAGDLLSAQETLDEADASLGALQADSARVGRGLARVFLGSLQTRLDRLQEILDEEAMMHFAAPLSVADDSLVALWYGGLPEVPPRPLEIIRNERVDRWIRHFTGPGRATFQKWLDRGEAYRPVIEETLARHELPDELYYLAMVESGFNLKARSKAAAVGPWQFIRGTARRYGLAIDYWVDERCDIVRSTEAACQHLAHLYNIFQDWNLAMAAYNSGEFRVQSAARRAGSRDFWDLKLPRETRDYVPKMMAAVWIGRDPAAHGFTTAAPPPFRYEDVSVRDAVDLSVIAKKGRFKKSDLTCLNPHLLRWCTPPDRPGGYALHVPPGRGGHLETALAQLSREERMTFRTHKVRRGETLYEIARGYGTTVDAIMRRNNIHNPRTLSIGSRLVVPTHPDQPFRQPQPNGVRAAAEKVLPPLDVPAGMAKMLYTVRRGDNLSLIARRLGVSVGRLQRWNGLGRSTRIYPNQVLQYLATAREGAAPVQIAQGPVQRRVHVVRRGESLYSISRSYGTTVDALLGWNRGVSRNSILHPGDKLVLFVAD